MKKMKKMLLGLVGLVAVGTLAACSNTSGTSVKKVQDSKQLVLAVSPDYPPFEYQTIKNGKNTVVGIDIDLANAIAKKLDVKLKVSTMDFNNVLTALSQGKADIAISGISATTDRKKSFDFSNVYYDATNEIVVKKSDLSKYNSISDFKGLKLAAQKGSTQETAVNNQITGSVLVSLAATGDEINEVKGGMVSGAVLEDMIAKSFVAANPDLAIANVKIPNLKSNPGMAVAVQKGSTELTSKINEVISEMKSSGELEKIIQENYTASQKVK
ncbi:transporter substrate-binding domain-containing protein [Lactococcus fujiensis]|uniref:Amino acid ABC transporter substrate-binding protein n=1 Tax=Lactococcus fujiensis JCM 16395 TaxID=1291764 RepID=A0A2A5RIJ7_9LACT|nr:transporter substrate-binding domain-containing protein [Lactococcus fujiensis]PCR98951.1 amino acid ABC transporter substrate-binding protein [Lactococcus fujiensis JCM 16395]